MDELLTCSVCGHRFPAGEQNRSGCQACPLHKGCQMVCCPVCGHTDVDPSQSSLARWMKKLIGGRTVEPSFSDR